MGGCYSKNLRRKVNSRVPDENVPVRPFFRISINHDYDINDNVWIERTESNETELKQIIEKETVLDKISPGIEDNVYDFIDEGRMDAHSVNSLQNDNVWIERTESNETELKQIIEKETVLDKISPGIEDNVYDFIDEGRMDAHSVNSLQISKFIPPPVNGRPLPLPPPSPKLSLAVCRRQASNFRINSNYGDGSDEMYNGESKDDKAGVYETYRECQRIRCFSNVTDDLYYLHPVYHLPVTKTPHSTHVKAVLESFLNVRFFSKSKKRPTAIAQSRHIGPLPAPRTKDDPEPRMSKQDLQRELEETKCAEYAEMVNIFKPMIVQNILVHDILPLLPFIDNHADVYSELKQHSEKNAVVMLLNELERSKEIGKWYKFIDALERCGYSYIVDNIRGYQFINRGYQLEYLKKLTPVIAKQISPRELMPYLMHYDLLGDTDKDYILCECNNRGEYAAALTLLDRITKKHRDWYRLFIKALEDAEYEEVAVNLRIENLMKSGRVKDNDGNYYMGYVHRDRETEAAPLRNGAPCGIQGVIPRTPIRNKRGVQLPPPPMLENDEDVDNNQPTIRCKSSNVSEEINLKEVFDDIIFEQPNTQPKHTNPKFIQLEEEINELVLKEKEIYIEANLVKRKFYHCKNIVETKKKMRQLRIQIEEMEKEMAALNEAPDVGEENRDDDKHEEYNDTNSLYQSDIYKKLMLSIEHDEVFEKISAKLPIFDIEFPEESPLLLPLPIFSPKFNKSRIQQLQSDSGSSLDEMLQVNIYESCENAVLYR